MRIINISRLDTEKILDEIKSLQDFHSEHYITLEMKRKFIELIGNPRHRHDTVPLDLLERKVFYCRELLKIQSILAPGLSEYRAYISLHLAQAIYWRNRRNSLTEDSDLLPDLLRIVIDIWGQYRTESSEKNKALEAEDLLRKFTAPREDYNTKELEMRKLA